MLPDWNGVRWNKHRSKVRAGQSKKHLAYTLDTKMTASKWVCTDSPDTSAAHRGITTAADAADAALIVALRLAIERERLVRG